MVSTTTDDCGDLLERVQAGEAVTPSKFAAAKAAAEMDEIREAAARAEAEEYGRAVEYAAAVETFRAELAATAGSVTRARAAYEAMVDAAEALNAELAATGRPQLDRLRRTADALGLSDEIDAAGVPRNLPGWRDGVLAYLAVEGRGGVWTKPASRVPARHALMSDAMWTRQERR